MVITPLTIGERRFQLTSEARVSQLEHELLTAMRAGGGMVVIPAAGQDEVHALVTPGLPLVFESSDQIESSAYSDEADVSYESYLTEYSLGL